MSRAARGSRTGMMVLAVALLVCYALSKAHERRGAHGSDPVANTLRDHVLAPAQSTVANFGHWWRVHVSSTFEGARLARENETLKGQVLTLTTRNNQLESAQTENDRLRGLLRFERKSPRPLLPAEVIAIKPSNLIDTITLNRGARDGIGPHAIVVAPDGSLVGQVIDASAATCRVLLLTDSDSSVGAQVIESVDPVKTAETSGMDASRPVGEASGSDPESGAARAGLAGGDGKTPGAPDGATAGHDPDNPIGLCQGDRAGHVTLVDLPSDADVREGQTVMTNGIGAVFPRGIKIGRITAVKVDHTRSLKSATIRPAVDFDHLEEAFLLR